MSALDQLASDVARFKAEVYGKQPQVTATGRDYSRLGSLEGFDHLINETLLPSAAFRLVRDGTPVPVRAYTKTFGKRDPIRVADPALVFDWFGDGATIILESLHRYSPPLREFCRALEGELRHATQVNAYITPPGAQGFATHVDSHDVFVAQVFGRKRWMVYGADDVEGERAPLIERHLEVGDCLYIPKGFPHAAATTASASAHLTIGILPTKWSQFEKELTSLLRERGEDVIPPAEVEASHPQAMAGRLIDEMRTKLDEVSEDELTQRLARVFVTSRHHSLGGQLQRVLDAREVADPDEVVTRTEWARFDRDDEVIVILPDRELRFSARLAPALDVILQDGPFRVIDLKPHLDEDERRAMVARLLKEGLLELT
ncbi:MAG: JmjC domain-containing protein [Actinomycetota bacterium]